MGSKERDGVRKTAHQQEAILHHHGLIREVGHLDDLDHDMHTEISDIEAAERTSRYIVSQMQNRILSLR